MLAFNLIMLALATWYISYVIVKLDSPFHLLGRFREWAIKKSTLPDETLKPGSVGEWVSCIYCVSPYVGLVCWLLLSTALAPIIYPFAIAGGALMLHRYTGGWHV